jgi:hypothetical protein
MQKKTDRVYGIVRNREALNRDVPHHPPGAGLEKLDRRGFDVLPIDQRRRVARAVYGNGLVAALAPAHDSRESGDMIGVFVSDENGVDGFERLADQSETPRELAHAEPGIDQDSRFGRGEKRRITGTSACQNAEPDRNKSPSFCFSNESGTEAMGNIG